MSVERLRQQNNRRMNEMSAYTSRTGVLRAKPFDGHGRPCPYKALPPDPFLVVGSSAQQFHPLLKRAKVLFSAG